MVRLHPERADELIQAAAVIPLVHLASSFEVDLVVAGRGKDLDDVRSLLAGGEVDVDEVRDLLQQLEAALGQSDLVRAFEAALRDLRSPRRRR